MADVAGLVLLVRETEVFVALGEFVELVLLQLQVLLHYHVVALKLLDLCRMRFLQLVKFSLLFLISTHESLIIVFIKLVAQVLYHHGIPVLLLLVDFHGLLVGVQLVTQVADLGLEGTSVA